MDRATLSVALKMQEALAEKLQPCGNPATPAPGLRFQVTPSHRQSGAFGFRFQSVSPGARFRARGLLHVAGAELHMELPRRGGLGGGA